MNIYRQARRKLVLLHRGLDGLRFSVYLDCHSRLPWWKVACSMLIKDINHQLINILLHESNALRQSQYKRDRPYDFTMKSIIRATGTSSSDIEASSLYCIVEQ